MRVPVATIVAPVILLGAFVSGGWELVPAGDVVAEQPALFAWLDDDPGVMISTIDVPGDGRFYVASRARDNGDGTWRYDYTIMNYNSARAARGLSVPGGSACATRDVRFNDVDVDPVEGTDGTDWATDISTSTTAWSAPTFATDPDANAVRWGTAYSMGFVAACAPEFGPATLDLFTPGISNMIAADAWVPAAAACPADLDGSGDVGFSDVLAVIGVWGPCGVPCPEDLSGNGSVDFADILAMIGEWGACP